MAERYYRTSTIMTRTPTITDPDTGCSGTKEEVYSCNQAYYLRQQNEILKESSVNMVNVTDNVEDEIIKESVNDETIYDGVTKDNNHLTLTNVLLTLIFFILIFILIKRSYVK